MRTFNVLRSIVVAACLSAALLAVLAAGALAGAPIYLCIGEKAGQGVKSGGTTAPGSCPKVTETQKVLYVPVAVPKEAAEQEKLLSILPYIKYLASGVGGKPTIQFSGVNVQIVNGEGKTASVNGKGNLVLGYNEKPRTQTGSHNLVLGEGQLYSSYGDILDGSLDVATGSFSEVFGYEDSVSGPWSSVTGGYRNGASGGESSVSGGAGNAAEAFASSVSGGEESHASGQWSSVGGGLHSKASANLSSVGGGFGNTAEAVYSSIFGGKELKATKEYEAIP
jgi:hypothetical protein